MMTKCFRADLVYIRGVSATMAVCFGQWNCRFAERVVKWFFWQSVTKCGGCA